jgi:hypothetical protein
MVISGTTAQASRARAIIAEHLTFTRAYLTWDKEANEIEDALRRIWDSVAAGSGADALARLEAVETRMKRLELPYEEWEVLFRQKLQVEREALRRMAGLADDTATGLGARAEGRLREAAEAAVVALGEFRRAWRAEREGRGLGLVPFLTAAAMLSAKLVRDEHPGAPRRQRRLPAPDAHAEARLPKAA